MAINFRRFSFSQVSDAKNGDRSFVLSVDNCMVDMQSAHKHCCTLSIPNLFVLLTLILDRFFTENEDTQDRRSYPFSQLLLKCEVGFSLLLYINVLGKKQHDYLVSDWILASCQPHRVISEREREREK